MPQKVIFQELLFELEGQLNVLSDKSEENAHNTLRAIWHTAAGNRLSAISANDQDLPFLAKAQHDLMLELIKSRLAGIPLAHLTERQHFLGLDYILNKGHYIPRKETELLAQTAISLIQERYDKNENVVVWDICSGIGTIALAVAHYCENAQVLGSDIYQPALVAASINAKNLSLTNRSKFIQGNLFDPFYSEDMKDKADVIVSAPPYISTVKVKQMAAEIADHEPSEAFDAGPFGLTVFNSLISESPKFLMENGYLIFECGLGQGEFLAKRLLANKYYDEVTEIKDESGNTRVLKAKRAQGIN